MIEEDRYCDDCRTHTPHVNAGFMPVLFTKGDHSSSWENVAMCEKCGGLTSLAVTDEQAEQAHQRYLSMLIEREIMTREELETKGHIVK